MVRVEIRLGPVAILDARGIGATDPEHLRAISHEHHVAFLLLVFVRHYFIGETLDIANHEGWHRANFKTVPAPCRCGAALRVPREPTEAKRYR